jgi:hypothetical protein
LIDRIRGCFLTLVLALLTGCVSIQQSSDKTSRDRRELSITRTFGHFVDARMLNSDPLGEIYVVDRAKSGVVKFNKDLDSGLAVAGIGHEHRQFDEPSWLDARQSNSLAIADERNHRIEIYSRDLAYVATLTTRDNPVSERRFGYPKSVAVDNAGEIYVVDGEGHRVLKYRRDLQFASVLGAFAQASGAKGKLTDPVAVVADDNGVVAVLDAGGKELVSYDALGNAIARTSLEAKGSRLHTRNDTLFVVCSFWDEGVSISAVKVFETRTLRLLSTLMLPIAVEDVIPWKSEFILLTNQAAFVAH